VDFTFLAAQTGPETLARQFRETLYPAIRESLAPFAPELILATLGLAVLVSDLFLPLKRSKHLAWVALAACALCFIGILARYEESRSIFLGMAAVDPFSDFFKMFLLAAAFPVVVLSYLSKDLQGRRMGEYYFVLLTALLGGMLMASSSHFLMVFLSLEILSVSSYILVGYLRNDRRGAEAALKYIIYGSVAAAVLGYGLSIWFGLTGSADLGSLAKVAGGGGGAAAGEGGSSFSAELAAIFALLFVFAGLAFKMSAVPMHFWTPDVYEGAPTAVTAFLSVASKGAGFALALRFFGSLAASMDTAGAAGALWRKVDWRLILSVIAVLTMTLGNLAAMWQTNLKRLMAYSSIAHAGYLLMGLTILGTATPYGGMQTVAFYLVAYLAMNFGVFSVIVLLENQQGTTDLEGCRGLGHRAPFLALALGVFLFSLIGVPPTAGFMGKFQLFMGVIDAGSRILEAGGSQWWQYYGLALAAVINTAVSAYYYLRIVKAMYFERSEDARRLRSPILGNALVAALLFLTFYLCLDAGRILETTLDLSLHP
jgi:NADH-quinone oxidoreductase subunit N